MDHQLLIGALRRCAPNAQYLDDRKALEAFATALESDEDEAGVLAALEAARRERDEAREQRDAADVRADTAERKLLDAERAIDGQREQIATLTGELDNRTIELQQANSRIAELAPQTPPQS